MEKKTKGESNCCHQLPTGLKLEILLSKCTASE